ncbi:protoporphyrinogen oxidase HemJ [Candidatus Nitrosacidococcus tergens]|nr:protoporphyrinogen oxidase HemJ [Candidatus Nitrosacidococcus tergens]
MLWVKAFHIIFVVAWFAGLFYLPRLFVYHAQCEDELGQKRFKVMERKLYRGIMTPSGVLAIGFGLWLVYLTPAWLTAGWIHAKFALVLVLIGYHWYCGKLLIAFRENRNRYSDIFYRWFNEFPVFILVGIVILVVVKPF